MWVIMFMCPLSTSCWHASYLVSLFHIGLDFFFISSSISWVAYYINLLEEYGYIHPVFYVSYLHPHVGPVLPHPLPPLLLNDDAAGEYEVEDILDSRLGCYGTKYLIKCLRNPVFEAMWEPAKHLANAPDTLY